MANFRFRDPGLESGELTDFVIDEDSSDEHASGPVGGLEESVLEYVEHDQGSDFAWLTDFAAGPDVIVEEEVTDLEVLQPAVTGTDDGALPGLSQDGAELGARTSSELSADDRGAAPVSPTADVAERCHAADDPAGGTGELDGRDELRAIVNPPSQEMPPGIPEGFSLRGDGVYIVSPSTRKDDEPSEEFLCSPIRVTSRFRRRDGTGWGRFIAVTSPLGEERHVPVMDRTLEARSGRVLEELADLGLRLGRVAKARMHLVDLLKRWEPPVTKLSADRRGWADDRCEAFVLGDDTIIGDQNVIPLSMDLAAIAKAVASQGSSARWKSQVAALCIGNPLMMLATSQAFVGPLLELVGREGGGLHLRGRSSQGKTTLQRAAASVWGKPSFIQGWRTTANALEGTAAACNGMLLILDELGEVLGRDLDAAAYMLANGKGKGRATPLGGQAKQRRWKVAILSSGEIGIAEKIDEGGGRLMRGQQVRLIDIAADTRMHGAFDELHGCGDGADFARLVADRAASVYGTAGPNFVEWLLPRRWDISDAVRKSIAEFRGRAEEIFHMPPQGHIGRVVDWFGLVAAAGSLATDAGITGWQESDASRAALDVLGEWLDAQRSEEESGDQDTVERTRAYLLSHASEFVELGRDLASAPALGWKDEKLFYIPKPTWALIQGGVDATVAAHALDRSKFLRRGEGDNLMRKAPREIPGRPRVYAIKVTILNGPSVAESLLELPKAA